MTRIASGLLLLLYCGGAVAQRLVVETTAFTPLREAARVYVNSVDIDRATTLPASAPLSAPAPSGGLLVTPDAKVAAAVTAVPWTGRESVPDSVSSYVGVLEPFTLNAYAHSPVALPAGWLHEAGCMATDLSGRSAVVVLASRYEDGAWKGRLEAYPVSPDHAVRAEPSVWALPGAPVAAVSLGDGRVAVLCRGAAGQGPVVHVREVFTGDVSVEALGIAVDTRAGNPEPTGLAISPDGRWLNVLVSAVLLDRPTGNSATWLTRLDTVRFESSVPIELPALAEPAFPPAVAADGTVWAGTYDPANGFAYASRVVFTVEGPVLEAQIPFMELESPIHIAAAPDGPAVAVAAGTRLEIWPEGRGQGFSAAYSDPIEVVRWTAEGLFLGEGNRVHSVFAQSGAPLTTVAMGTGVVTDFALLPESLVPFQDADIDGLSLTDERALGSDPDKADTDGDDINDASDPEPLTASPRLSVPSVVTLHGESAGQEVRALLVDPRNASGSTWRVEHDSAATPWLSVYPLEGRAGDPVYLGVDASRYPANPGLLRGTLTIHLTGTAPERDAADSPAQVLVQVLPPPGDQPSVLWLLNESKQDPSLLADAGPKGLRALATLLAANPHRFSHDEAAGTFLASLAPYRVVVIGAKAAADGAVTRQALLDYVADGGALLLLGDELNSTDARSLANWLGPVGIYIDGHARLDGSFPTNRPHWLCRHWNSFALEGGCGIRADNPDSVLVPGPTASGLSAFVAQPYGRGRIAVLASPTPLQSRPMQARENRRFASDLFDWLARNGTEMEDVDGDGLPDVTEDTNRNGVRDPGETDRFNADTDGDGIPDGLEDRNRNSRVDEDETHPLNPDSDGNGIPDGADVDPLPAAGTPVVYAVAPVAWPAEGGATVLVSGRNFDPGCALYFGDRAAADVHRLSARTLSATLPPSALAEGGDVGVRVVNKQTGQENTLPGGFRYSARSRVRVILEAASVGATGEDGLVTVRVEGPPSVDVGRISLRLEPDLPGTIEWGDVTAGAGAQFSGRTVGKRPSPSGGVWIDVSPGRVRTAPGELAVVRWHASTPGLRVTAESVRLTAANGQPLDATTAPAVLPAR